MTDRRTLMAGMAASAGLCLLPRTAMAHQTVTQAESVLDRVFADTSPVALAGGIVTQDGLVWSGVRGVRRFGQADAATANDRWHLGSNTKAMTAATYGRLVERGLARWEATVPELFSDLSIDPSWRTTTALDLMHHRAGLLDDGLVDLPWIFAAQADSRPVAEQRKALAAKAFGAPPAGPVGAFAYGNGNYIVAGAAIERIAAKPWEDVIRAEVFEPLGLASAGFGAPLHDTIDGANAWGHDGSGDGRTPMDPSQPGSDNPPALGPAGTVHMTLSDYAIFVRQFLAEGGSWLKSETIAVLTRPQGEDANPYACGWGVRPQVDWAMGPVLQHDGSNTLWHARTVVAPRRGLAFIGLTNESPERGSPRALVEGLISASG